MNIALELNDELVAAVATRVAEIVLERLDDDRSLSPWLDADGVAEYASMSLEGIRAATKRNQIKSYRSCTGRVRYRREDVDAFLRGEG